MMWTMAEFRYAYSYHLLLLQSIQIEEIDPVFQIGGLKNNITSFRERLTKNIVVCPDNSQKSMTILGQSRWVLINLSCTEFLLVSQSNSIWCKCKPQTGNWSDVLEQLQTTSRLAGSIESAWAIRRISVIFMAVAIAYNADIWQ